MVLRLPDSWSNWIWKCWFLRRGENRSTRTKTFRSKGENQQQNQPTYGVDAGIWTRATLVGGECFHHCATLAPQHEEMAFHIVQLCAMWLFNVSGFFHLFFLTKLWRRVIERGSCRCCRFKTVDALYGFAYLLPGSCLESGTLAVSLFGNPIILAFFYKTRRVKETFNYHSRIMLFSLTHNYAKTLLLNQLRKFEERVMWRVLPVVVVNTE